jgi:uncharacterized protein (DUF305 family)
VTLRITRLPLLAVLVAGLMTVAIGAAQGGKDAKDAHPSRANETDRTFVGLMTPHHEGGVELGRMAAEKGTNPEIVRLGRDIVAEQSAELELLTSWATRLKVEPGMPEPIQERDMIDMERLQAASGAQFDRMWLDVISAHHAAAIQMALIEEAGGRYGPSVRLAASIVESQSSQLEEFNALTRALEG